ncbi:hypothetical protein GCM10027421_04700 [Microbacterium shaanxiense]
MITDWIAQSGLIGLAILVLFGPGLLIGAGLRLRGLTLWAAAPAISVGLLAVLAIAFPYLGVRWGHLSVGIAFLLIAAVTWGCSMLLRRGRVPSSVRLPSRGATPMLTIGLVIGGGLNAARLLTYIGVPDAISQTNDAVFHLNALRWIAQTGSASSFDVSGLVGGSTFYPSAWHAVTSLVALDNASIPVAVNAVSLVIAAAVWPLGIAYLTRVVSRGNASATALAAALSAGLMAFPQLMFEWGVLYPYALSLAVVPVATALTITTLRAWATARPGERLRAGIGPLVAGMCAVTATTIAQPSTILVWAVLVMLWASGELMRHHRAATERRRRILIVSVIVAGWLAIAVVWAVLAFLAGIVLWRAYRSPFGALADVLTNGHSQLPPALAMSGLLVVGLVCAIRANRLRWLAVAWIGVSALYVISVATDLPVIKRLLTGPWYGDSFRLAAIVPIVVVPLAAIGLDALVRWIVAFAAARHTRVNRRALTVAAMLVTALVGALSVMASPVTLLRVAAETDEQSRYALNDDSYLSLDEYELLRSLPDLVPSDALIIANPSTGAAFAYVLGEREIIPRTWSPPQSVAWEIISEDLRDASEDDGVCEALAAYGYPDYVLDFGPGDDGPGQYVMPGMTDFEHLSGFELVAGEGDATLWRITACDQAPSP